MVRLLDRLAKLTIACVFLGGCALTVERTVSGNSAEDEFAPFIKRGMPRKVVLKSRGGFADITLRKPRTRLGWEDTHLVDIDHEWLNLAMQGSRFEKESKLTVRRCDLFEGYGRTYFLVMGEWQHTNDTCAEYFFYDNKDRVIGYRRTGKSGKEE